MLFQWLAWIELTCVSRLTDIITAQMVHTDYYSVCNDK